MMSHGTVPSPQPRDDMPPRPLRIVILAAGAGGMFCGSCLRDSALAAALIRAGQDVTLVPLYTPLRTEGDSPAIDRIFYGGVNVYLQHASRLFRHTPRLLDWLFDRPGLLRLAGTLGAQTSPSRLGGITLDILRGEDGASAKELRRLLTFLEELRPDIVSLPNLMFIGAAQSLRRELGVPVVCELTGEDLFLGQLVEPHRSRVHNVIRERAHDVTSFVATSAYYADQMSAYLGVPRTRIDVVYPGVPQHYLDAPARPCPTQRPPTVGFLARICPEKGFGRLLEAMARLRPMPGMANAQTLAGGYLGAGDRKWFEATMKSSAGGAVRHVGELDSQSKLNLLDDVDVVCVPTVHPEPKGIYVLEALARGVPVVLPAHGSFPELIEATGGGLLVPPGDAAVLASALAELLADGPRRAQLGQAGQAAVRNAFTEDVMAARMLECYRRSLVHGDSSDQPDVAMVGEAR
jgi:glycosyltransferase involved in cell wall biosynthesis